MNIGQRIKKRREEIDLSQEELAKKLGYKSRSSINKIEKDGQGIPQSKIKAFASALNTTPSYIMGWEEMNDVMEDFDSHVANIIEQFEYAGYQCDIDKDYNQIIIDNTNSSLIFDLNQFIEVYDKINQEKLIADATIDKLSGITDDEKVFIEIFRSLNTEGKKDILSIADNMRYNPKYTKSIKLTPLMKEKPTNGYVIAAHNNNEDPDQLEKMERDGERMLAEAARRRAKRNE